MGGSEGTDDDIGWAEQLERAHTKKGKQPPGDGWKTFLEINEEMGCGVCKCRRIITEAKNAGELEVFHGSAESPTTSTLCRQIWYRPVKD